MTELRIENWTMPGAEVGAENPLPPLEQGIDLHQIEAAETLPADMRENMGYGHLHSILPYTMQDGYSRQRTPMVFKVAVLENEILRAAFLLDYGGRMWSLLHKPTGRDLVRVNPVFQPANLALRNAWFSGGVEWNIGTIGHTPLTCSPLFAARVDAADETPILRLYEWERIRQVSFQLDFYLPDRSPLLFVFARIINPHDTDVPMYWWSNIAVAESVDTRVVVPAESAYRFDYRRTIEILPVPEFDGVDRTYSTNTARAIDYFFHINDDRHHWIAALDRSGTGLAQYSSSRLQGRKLFLWGRGRGGTHWQNFLSKSGFPYIEIQAGLARTQLEHLRMPAHAKWSWLEGYGMIEADGAVVHGDNWQAAQQTVEQAIEKLTSPSESNGLFVHDPERLPTEMLHHGAGWGALERRRREVANLENFAPDALPFSDGALGKHQQAWMLLLETGRFPETDPDSAPLSYMVQSEWRDLLEASLQNPANENWAAWLHVGVMRYYAGEKEAARDAWTKSLEHRENVWALRNLAVYTQSQASRDEAAELYLKAHKLKPTLRVLTIETTNALLKAQRPQECLALIKSLSAADRKHGRIRLLEAQAALAIGDIDRTARIFASQLVVDDIREGDTTLTELWQRLYEHKVSKAEKRPIDDTLRAEVRERYPLPDHYNFRMTE